MGFEFFENRLHLAAESPPAVRPTNAKQYLQGHVVKVKVMLFTKN